MRVGIDGRVLQDHFPGIGRYLYCLVRALSAADLQITLFYDPAAPAERFNPRDLAGGSVRLEPLVQPVFSLLGQWRAARAIDRFGLDLFHAPYFLCPIGLRTPMVLTLHDAIPLKHPSSLPSLASRLAYGPLLRRALATAKHVITDSQASADEVIARGLLTPAKVTVVPLAADAIAPPANEPLPESWPKPPYLLNLSIDKPLKNQPMLVRAYAASGVTTPLVLAGPRDVRYSATAEAIAVSGVGSQVFRVGPVPDSRLGDLYRGAQMFLFPSLAEGFGLPPLEAMAMGVPVICSSADSLPEVAGDAAIILRPDDEVGWARAIRDLAADGRLRASLADAGRVRAKQFSWEKTSSATLVVYRKVAGVPATAEKSGA